MGDSAITVVAIFLAAILMFIFPLMTMADKQDDVTQLNVEIATTEFTDKIRATGKLTQDEYDNFILTLAATGNSYDVEIIIQRIDENLSKKENGVSITIGDNVYYTEYTTQVLNDLAVNAGTINLKEGDIISVNVENTNSTIADQLKNWFYKVIGKSSGSIAASASGFVTATGK